MLQANIFIANSSIGRKTQKYLFLLNVNARKSHLDIPSSSTKKKNYLEITGTNTAVNQRDSR